MMRDGRRSKGRAKGGGGQKSHVPHSPNKAARQVATDHSPPKRAKKDLRRSIQSIPLAILFLVLLMIKWESGQSHGALLLVLSSHCGLLFVGGGAEQNRRAGDLCMGRPCRLSLIGPEAIAEEGRVVPNYRFNELGRKCNMASRVRARKVTVMARVGVGVGGRSPLSSWPSCWCTARRPAARRCPPGPWRRRAA